jgi:REP element-mobilizing transposase RayT
MASHQHKEWFSRGYLPHFDHPGLCQAITYHLADSLPKKVLKRIEEMAQIQKEPVAELRRQIHKYLDAGYGACYLKDPQIAALVEQSFFYFDGERYNLLAWVVMPNHVHVLIETFVRFPLYTVIHSWKSFTAQQANTILHRKGPFWYREYYDRFIRDEQHFHQVVFYMHNNPVQAGLVSRPEDFLFSSARYWQANGSPASLLAQDND